MRSPWSDPAQLALPLDAYDFTTEGYRNFIEAQHLLTKECLARFGVTVPEAAWDTSELATFDDLNARRYGLLDLSAARSRGYNPPPGVEDDQVFASLAEVEEYRRGLNLWEPSDLERLLLDGRDAPELSSRPLPHDVNGDPLPEAGCRGEAKHTVAAGLGDPQWPLDAGLGSYSLATNDTRVRAAVADRSRCMDARGYSYSSIMEPNDLDWPEPVTDEEVATATADVECKLETNVVGVWYAVGPPIRDSSSKRTPNSWTSSGAG